MHAAPAPRTHGSRCRLPCPQVLCGAWLLRSVSVRACVHASMHACSMQAWMYLSQTQTHTNTHVHTQVTYLVRRPACANARTCAHRHPHRQADSRTGRGRGRGSRGTVEAEAPADAGVRAATGRRGTAAKHTKAAVPHMPAIRRRFLTLAGLRLPKTRTTQPPTPVRAHTHASAARAGAVGGMIKGESAERGNDITVCERRRPMAGSRSAPSVLSASGEARRTSHRFDWTRRSSDCLRRAAADITRPVEK